MIKTVTSKHTKRLQFINAEFKVSDVQHHSDSLAQPRWLLIWTPSQTASSGGKKKPNSGWKYSRNEKRRPNVVLRERKR